MNATGWLIRLRLPVVCLFLLLCQSCTSQPLALSTRPVTTTSTWFVRLDASPQSNKPSESRYDHPLEWAEADIAAILRRLLLQQETGILRQHRSLEPVFTPEEVTRLAPALQEAFRRAKPDEWVSFAFLQPSGTNLTITSGGFFFRDRLFHAVLANYREAIHEYAVDVELVRENPLRSVRELNGRLTFDPLQFVTDSTTNWAGHSHVAASEIVLDHRGVHDYVTQLPQATTTGAAAAGGDSSLMTSASLEKIGELSAQIRKLEAQVETLTQRNEAKDALLLKLMKEVETLRAAKRSKVPTPPPSR